MYCNDCWRRSLACENVGEPRGFEVIERGTAFAPFMGPPRRSCYVRPRYPAAPPPQLKVCNLSFSDSSAWRSNTCVAMPEKVAGLPSLSLPLALQLAVP